MADLQDVYIRVSGYNNINEAGDIFPDSDPGLLELKKKIETPSFLARRKPIVLIKFRGGEGAKNRSEEMVQKILVLQNTNTSLGAICITGGSAGGKVALEIASKLTNVGQTIRYIGIADGAFQKSDVIIDSPLTFKSPKIMCLQKENFFQSWGHTLDPSQELHGLIEGFNNKDLTNSQAVSMVKAKYENIWLKLGRDKQKAMDDAHTAAYSQAFNEAEEKILWIFSTL